MEIMTADIPIVKLTQKEIDDIWEQEGIKLNEEIFLKDKK